MIRIAVVGEIGSGKTYISHLFDLPVFSADEEVSKIYKNNKKFFLKLKKKLPKFIKSFPINKKELSKAILNDNNNLKKISKIIHPLVRYKMNRFIKKNFKKKAIILDIPLYFENKINKKKDIVIYVYGKRSQILKRLKLRKDFNIKIYDRLKKIQLSNEKKKKRSNLYIKNNFNKKSLKKEINMLKLKIF